MNSIAVNLIVAVLLLAANAFYVAAEFALVKSRGFRVKAMAERNKFGAHLLLQIRTRALDGTLRPLLERWYPGLANANQVDACHATAG